MITVFWDCEGMILVNAMQRGETVTPSAYIRTLTWLRKHFRGIKPDKNPTEILLQHDNARSHTSLKTRAAITKLGWAVLPHPPYSHDLSPSDFQLSGAQNDAIHGMKFRTDKDIIHAMSTWLRQQGPRSRRRLWYEVNPSLFIMCSFHDLGTNACIYWEKNKGCYFQGKPRTLCAHEHHFGGGGGGGGPPLRIYLICFWF